MCESVLPVGTGMNKRGKRYNCSALRMRQRTNDWDERNEWSYWTELTLTPRADYILCSGGNCETEDGVSV